MAITIEIIIDHTLVSYYLALLINPKVKDIVNEKLIFIKGDKNIYVRLSDVIEKADIEKLGKLKSLLKLVKK